MPSRLRLFLGFAMICLIWGSTWLAMKEGLSTVPPLTSATLRFIVAIGLLVGLLFRNGLKMPKDRAYLKLVIETGLLIYAIPFGLIYWGQSQIPSGLSSVLFATFPFFVALAGRFRIPGESLPPLRILGIVLGFLGILLVFRAELGFDSALSPLGMGAIVLSAALQAYALISIRIRGEHVHPVPLTLGGIIVGEVLLSLFAIVLEWGSNVQLTSVAVLSILYLAAFGTVATFVTYFWLVKFIDPVILALSAFITPLIALSLGSLVRGEHFSTDLLAGAGVVLTGVLLANGSGIQALVREFRGSGGV